MTKQIDYTGVRINDIIGVNPTEKRKNKKVVWVWKCDCDTLFEDIATDFVYKGNGRCRECAQKHKSEVIKLKLTKHNMSSSKEYRSWASIKRRCRDKNSPDYWRYGAKGIDVDQEFYDAFQAFFDYIGPMPDDGKDYSCGRIDNDIGYIKGNIRWETSSQQTRNRGIMRSNTSGTTGVYIKGDGIQKRYIAGWKDIHGRLRTKSFSVNKYGDEFARFLAEECRDVQIRRLNLILGNEGYSPKHGL